MSLHEQSVTWRPATALAPVFFVSGTIISALAVAMLPSALIDAIDGHASAMAFAATAVVTLFFGVLVAICFRSPHDWKQISNRQALLMISCAWGSTAVTAAFPLFFAGDGLSFVDSLFEAMSGITTTGATILVDPSEFSRGILLWRAILQWTGGAGIILTALSILPMLRVGGMQLFRLERLEDREDQQQALPRATSLALHVLAIYSLLTVTCGLAIHFAGLPFFEASIHAMTALSTGGFSSNSQSIGGFNLPALEWILCIFMVLGALPTPTLWQVFNRRPKLLFTDSQILSFCAILALAIGIVTVILITQHDLTPLKALRLACFNLTAVMTGTGYASADYAQWGGAISVICILVMAIGGCSASTTSGIKVFRLQMLAALSRAHLLRLIQPNGVFVATYKKKPIPDSVAISVLAFFFLYFATYTCVTILLALTGLDPITAASSALAAVANVGPGLGPIVGPMGNYASLSDPAKIIMVFAMFAGRLEIFPVLALCLRFFWRL